MVKVWYDVRKHIKYEYYITQNAHIVYKYTTNEILQYKQLNTRRQWYHLQSSIPIVNNLTSRLVPIDVLQYTSTKVKVYGQVPMIVPVVPVVTRVTTIMPQHILNINTEWLKICNQLDNLL